MNICSFRNFGSHKNRFKRGILHSSDFFLPLLALTFEEFCSQTSSFPRCLFQPVLVVMMSNSRHHRCPLSFDAEPAETWYQAKKKRTLSMLEDLVTPLESRSESPPPLKRPRSASVSSHPVTAISAVRPCCAGKDRSEVSPRPAPSRLKLLPRAEWGPIAFFSVVGYPCLAPRRVFDRLLYLPALPLTCTPLYGHELLEDEGQMPLTAVFAEHLKQQPFVAPVVPPPMTAETRVRLPKGWGTIRFAVIDGLPLFIALEGIMLLQKKLADQAVPAMRIIQREIETVLRGGLVWDSFCSAIRVQVRNERDWFALDRERSLVSSDIGLDLLRWCDGPPPPPPLFHFDMKPRPK